MKMRVLAAKAALVVALSTGSLTVHAGIPVIDGANLSQTIMTAIESIAQTLKQVEEYATQLEQYSTQLQQYENQLQNTAAPAAYIWDAAQSTINGLMDTVDTLSYYRAHLGSIDSYLGKFQDVAYYRGSPCFSDSGCSDAEWAAMSENRRLAAESQRKANEALFRGLDRQQSALRNDARTLEQLQSRAQSADGQMQALGYANQLASQQANQLLQIRGLLIAQQNAVVTRMQAEADREALQTAASEALRKNGYTTSPGRAW